MHGIAGMGFGMMWLWIPGLLLLVLIVWLVAKSTNQNNRDGGRNRSALDILKERYARGEIDKDEFEEKMSHLNSKSA